MLVSRDSFARQEIHRDYVPAGELTTETCAWCGNRGRRGQLYLYRLELDGGRSFKDTKLFCSSSCRNLYWEL